KKGPLFLWEAAWHFAPGSMKAAATEERAKPVPKLRVKRFENIDEQVFAPWEAIHNSVETFLRSRQDPHEPTLEMQATLITRILKGKFKAVGIMTMPKVGKRPEEIPLFIFEGQPKIGWAKNVIENVGHRFEGVKV